MQNFRVLASILTDIFHFLLEKGREKESKLVSKLRDQYVELPIFQREKAELKKTLIAEPGTSATATASLW